MLLHWSWQSLQRWCVTSDQLLRWQTVVHMHSLVNLCCVFFQYSQHWTKRGVSTTLPVPSVTVNSTRSTYVTRCLLVRFYKSCSPITITGIISRHQTVVFCVWHETSLQWFLCLSVCYWHSISLVFTWLKVLKLMRNCCSK